MQNPVNATGAREGNVINMLHSNNQTSVNVPINGRGDDVANFNALTDSDQEVNGQNPQGTAGPNMQAMMEQALPQLQALMQMLQQFMGEGGATNASSTTDSTSGQTGAQSATPDQVQQQPQPSGPVGPNLEQGSSSQVIERGEGSRVVERGEGSQVVERGEGSRVLDRTNPSITSSQEPVGQFNEESRTLTLDDGTTIQVKGRFDVTAQYQNPETGKTEELEIWGDPHVNFDDDVDSGPGASHVSDFWRDRTFVLPNGTELTFNTAPFGNGDMTVTSGVDVVHKGQAFQMTGIDSEGLADLEVTHFADGARFDAVNPDGVTTLHSSFTDAPSDKGFAQVEKDGSLTAFENLNKTTELGNETELTNGMVPGGVTEQGNVTEPGNVTGPDSGMEVGSAASEGIMGLFEQLQQLFELIAQALGGAMAEQSETSDGQMDLLSQA